MASLVKMVASAQVAAEQVQTTVVVVARVAKAVMVSVSLPIGHAMNNKP